MGEDFFMAASAAAAVLPAAGSAIARAGLGNLNSDIAIRLPRHSSIVNGAFRGQRVKRRAAARNVLSYRTRPTICLGRHDRDQDSENSKPSLADICRCLQHCFFEICVENRGRPAGTALHEFVGAAVAAYLAGHTRDRLSLQLAYGDNGMEESKLETEGFRLTASEEQYRSQWLDTIYTTLQFLKVVDNQASRSSPVTAQTDSHLFSIVRRVVEGQQSGDEQSFVKFDRGLATKGASGGAIAQREAVAPQFIPLTQLVLLTMKVVNEDISV